VSRSGRPFNRGIVLFPAKTSHSGEWEPGEPVATSSRTTWLRRHNSPMFKDDQGQSIALEALEGILKGRRAG
jgi:hypothetical protein